MAQRRDGDELTSIAEACEYCAARAQEPCELDCDCPACLERRAELQAWARWHHALGLTKAIWLCE
jgi:hypothetical protein